MAVAILKLGQSRWRSMVIGAILVALAGCDQPAESPDLSASNGPALPDVVATSTILADWTSRVGGDAINLVSILSPGADPHIYEPVPQDSIALEEAELIFYNGYNLEPNLIRLIQSTGITARTVAAAEIVPPLDFDDEGQTVPDPHVWGDASNAIQILELIRDELTQLDPGNEAEFAQNAAVFIEELTQLHAWISEQIATIPASQRQLITTHDAFQYYTTAYGLEVGGTLIGISTEEQPSAQTVQRLADAIRASSVPAIFAETTINSRLIAIVAAEAQVQLASQELYSDSLGSANSEEDTYINMMTTNTRVIVENLGGSYTPFMP